MPDFDTKGIFSEAYRVLTEGTSPKLIESIETDFSLPFVGRGTTRLAFRADTHCDGNPTVVKIAIEDRGGQNAIARENQLWQRADKPQRELLTPILEADEENRWLVMPAIDTGVSQAQAHEFHRRLTATGLAMRDVTKGDIGIHNTGWMLVDYAGCKEIQRTPVTKEKMKTIVDKRWNGWTK